MKLYSLIFTSISLFLCANGQEEEGTTNSDNAVAEDLLNSSFFAEVLENAKNSDSDAMGTQRVVDLEESIFSPSKLNFKRSGALKADSKFRKS